MPINNDATDFRASVALALNRTDLTALIPDFIIIAEARMNSDLRLREGVTVTTLPTVADQQYIALPTDWREFLSISYDGKPLTYISAERLQDLSETAGAEPTYYSIEGSRLLLSPTPDAVYSLNVKYYASIPALADYGVNWLLQKYPHVYLYATLVSAWQHLMNEQKADYYGNLYAQAVAVAKTADERARSSGSPLTIRPRR